MTMRLICVRAFKSERSSDRAIFNWIHVALVVVGLVPTARASAQTITIDSYSNVSGTATSSIPFFLLSLGTGTANTLQTSATVTSLSTPVVLPSGSEIASIAFGSGTTASGVFAGGVAGLAASPFGAADTTTNYLAAGGGNGTVTVSYTQAQTSLNMLWGSLDSGNTTRNVVAFKSSTGATVGTVNGFQIAEALVAAGGSAAGSPNVALGLSGISPFTSVVFSDANGPAFELALGTATSGVVFGGRGVPEPASLALLASAVTGLGIMRRRRKSL